MELNGANSDNRSRNAQLTIILLVIAAIIAAAFLMLSMRKSVNSSAYLERSTLLGNLTESNANILNDNISYEQTLTDIITDNAEQDIKHFSSLEEYIGSTAALAGYSSREFFFVDSNGGYYSSDGVYGKITDRTYYTESSPDKLSYISSLPHYAQDKAYLIFRNRLSKPLAVTTVNGEVKLVYCGLLYNIDNLNSTISREFDSGNNTFIYDDSTGVMMYKNFGIKLLIDGFNIYSKLYQCNVLFDEDPAELEQTCRSRETAVAAITIDGEEFYFCSAPINHEEWSVAFIVRSEYLNEVSGNSIGKVVLFVTLIALVLGTLLLLLIASLYKNSVSKKSIREISQLNAELDRATRAKSDFLSNMSHDIRTPINGIMGMTTIAKAVEGNPAKTDECLNKIDEASQHLLSLVNDVLDMNRIERGAVTISQNPIDIRTVCDNCCSIIKGQMTYRELEFITEINCEHAHVLGDDLRIRQVLINILGNAVKFTQDGGRIVFRCRETGATEKTVTYAFEIEDNGIGMKPEFIPNIFEAFTQDEGGARSKYKGTGLGMAISKQLTEMMHGTIELESELDKGSKFTVTIPFPISNENVEAEKSFVEDADIAGIKILLVEDNDLNTEIAVELLGAAGAVVTAAEDGRQAVELFEKNPPASFDVILMDIMMPVMNGLDATRAIRALDREDAKRIPILAMTSNAFESDIRATIEAGMNAHLSKPIQIKNVIRTIEYYVGKNRDNT